MIRGSGWATGRSVELMTYLRSVREELARYVFSLLMEVEKDYAMAHCDESFVIGA